MVNSEDINAELAQLEEEIKQMETTPSDNTPFYPTPEKKDGTLLFFRDLIKAKDSRKIANINNQELGITPISVRGYLNIANFCASQNLNPSITAYFNNRAEIVAATSMSHKGFLVNLAVTQIKREQKLMSQPEQKKGFFSSFSKPKEGEQQ